MSKPDKGSTHLVMDAVHEPIAGMTPAAAREEQARRWAAYYALRDADAAAAMTSAEVLPRYQGRTLAEMSSAEQHELAAREPVLYARMRAAPRHALPAAPDTLAWGDLTNAQREHLARTDRAAFDRMLERHRAALRGPFDELLERRRGVL